MRFSTRLLVVFSFATVPLVAPTASYAAAATPTQIAVARKLFAESVELQNADDWSGAESRLREILHIKQTPGVYYHLAFCMEMQQRLVEASVNYSRARELINSGTKADEVEALLDYREPRLAERIPTVRIQLDAGVAEPTLLIDGNPIAVSLAVDPIPVDSGPHHVQVLAEGYESFEGDFRVEEGDSVQMSVAMRPVAIGAEMGSERPANLLTADPADPVVAEAPPSTPWLGYALAGGALAALGGSAFSFTKSGSRGRVARTLAVDCDAGDRDACERHDGVADTRDTYFTIGLALAGTAVGLGAAATWQLWPEPTEDQTGWTLNYATRF
jgi:hypothetical protein